jgi:hypothetical protein
MIHRVTNVVVFIKNEQLKHLGIMVISFHTLGNPACRCVDIGRNPNDLLKLWYGVRNDDRVSKQNSWERSTGESRDGNWETEERNNIGTGTILI